MDKHTEPSHAAPPATAAESESRSILALDLGTCTGWALRATSGAVTSGTHEFRPGRFEGAGMAFLRFDGWLGETLRLAGRIDAVAFEEVRAHAGTLAAQVYGGFLAHLTAWCEQHAVPYLGVPVATIKRHATGKGNASKGEVIAAMKRRGHDPRDDNEADALAILHWAISHGIGA